MAAAQAPPAPPQTPPAPAAPAQTPPAQPAPVRDYQDAVYENLITCSPNADSDYCSNVADKFYLVRLNGKDYALVPAYSYKQSAVLAAAEVAASAGGMLVVELMHTNILRKQPDHTPVQMRFHGGGVDVRVLKETKNGTQKYVASHYVVAKKVPIEPPHPRRRIHRFQALPTRR
jgi:hypothetical protein